MMTRFDIQELREHARRKLEERMSALDLVEGLLYEQEIRDRDRGRKPVFSVDLIKVEDAGETGEGEKRIGGLTDSELQKLSDDFEAASSTDGIDL